jgi:hypothetical protein
MNRKVKVSELDEIVSKEGWHDFLQCILSETFRLPSNGRAKMVDSCQFCFFKLLTLGKFLKSYQLSLDIISANSEI